MTTQRDRMIKSLETAREYRDELLASAEGCKSYGGQSYADRMAEYHRACETCRRLSDAIADTY